MVKEAPGRGAKRVSPIRRRRALAGHGVVRVVHERSGAAAHERSSGRIIVTTSNNMIGLHAGHDQRDVPWIMATIRNACAPLGRRAGSVAAANSASQLSPVVLLHLRQGSLVTLQKFTKRGDECVQWCDR